MAEAKTTVDDVIEKVLNKFNLNEMKRKQRDILDCLIEGNDCVGILPTGFGKSLPYQMYVPVMRELHSISPDRYEDPGKILVCCPLVSLMRDQVQRLSKLECISSTYKGCDEESKTDMSAADVIFASPESLVGDRHWREELQSFNVSVIVIDEFHTIDTWGELAKDEEEKVFRKWFRNIGELRSLFPKATLLALSATCTRAMKSRVLKVLNMDENTVSVTVSPNRSNIKFVVHRMANDIESAMFWLVNALDELKEKFPRTLIYCNSFKDVYSLYMYITRELPTVTDIVEMFHSETTDATKKSILSRLSETNSKLRIVISTSALGMGVDVTSCHNVILYGPPKSIVDLLQESGRAGRDGGDSVSLILCNSYQLRHVDEEIKQVIRTTVCRRLAIMECFMNSKDIKKLTDRNKHTCCDLCKANCNCGSCSLSVMEKFLENVGIVNILSDSESDSDTISYEYESDVGHSFSLETEESMGEA